MNTEGLEKILDVIRLYPAIKLAYLFGSKASDQAGPLSDYDFAFYVDLKDEKRIFDLKLSLQDQITRALKTDEIDIVILNLIKQPEMKYSIIKNGQLFYEEEPYRVIIEPKILNEYFDFREILRRHHLTRS